MDEWFVDSLKWYGVLVLVSLCLAPLARWLFAWLPDRGASVVRPLGLLALLWPVWFVAGVSSIPYSPFLLWPALVFFGVLGWYLAYRLKWITRVWVRSLALVEGVSLVAFFAYIGLRGFTPQITWTEKPMDIAFLTSATKTTEIPPADPWFSGEPINYYYLGYLVHGTIGRLSDIPTWTGFNFALATTASMTLVAAAGLAFNAIRLRSSTNAALFGGVLAGFLVVLAGNMRAAVEFVRDPGGVIDQSWWPPGTVGWASSRIVVDTGSPQAETINEFPWFSLLLGDLHPHLTALPFTILALSLALNLLLASGGLTTGGRQMLVRLVISGCVAGALYPLNSLDLPTFLAILAGAVFLPAGWSRRSVMAIARE